MLDENEFEQVLIELLFGGESLHHGVPEAEAFRSALDPYEEFTGLRETNFRALYHHRIAMYGPPCEHCGQAAANPGGDALRRLLAARARAWAEVCRPADAACLVHVPGNAAGQRTRLTTGTDTRRRRVTRRAVVASRS